MRGPKSLSLSLTLGVPALFRDARAKLTSFCTLSYLMFGSSPSIIVVAASWSTSFVSALVLLVHSPLDAAEGPADLAPRGPTTMGTASPAKPPVCPL